jgi:hypothetical protein
MSVLRKRNRKFIASFVLAFWVFAIFANVVHACTLDEDLGRPFHVAAAGVHGHDGSHDEGCPGCASLCADDLAVLAKLKAIQDPPTGQTLLTPAPLGDTFRIAASPVSSLLTSPVDPPAIAVNTRFVRLAL